MRQEARDVKAYKPGKCSVRKVSGRRKKLTPDELKEQARKEKAIKDAKMFAEFWAKFEKENKEAFVIPGKYRSKKVMPPPPAYHNESIYFRRRIEAEEDSPVPARPPPALQLVARPLMSHLLRLPPDCLIRE